MPRGIPKDGKRKPGGGRPKKYGERTTHVRVPESIAPKIADIFQFLADLDRELEGWESEISAKDLKTNPRYSKASEMAHNIRGLINGLGIESKVVSEDD